LFSKGFKKHGARALSTYLTNYKIGEYVDIKGDGAVHKGMPHKFYHGKTGIVWNVTPHAVGVELLKPIGNRFLKKRIHVRIEHVKKSKCRKEFLERLVSNEETKKQCKATGERYNLKREPQGPRKGFIVKTAKRPETLRAVAWSGYKAL